MIMKHIVIKTGIVMSLAFTLGSCSDFFDLLPPNEVVLEKFYTEENDIIGVVNSCYAGLESVDCINRMAVWGEGRSDNLVAGSNVPYDETQLLKENIIPNTKYASWAPFYTVINRCNTVLYYAPIVNQRDPNYTLSEMKATMAEVKGIRALCYFYLVRVFRNVPFVMEPSIDDNQNYLIPPSSGDSIISCLIEDLDNVKNDAVREFPNKVNNTARFTKYGIYALLADLYLWKGDYESCINCCDVIIDYKKRKYQEEIALYGNNTELELFNGYPLISESPNGSSKSGNAYNRIFGEGNSFESILELYFEENQSVANTFISSYYGSSSNTMGYFSAAPFLGDNVATGANELFKNTDCRFLENMQKSNTMYAITKYTRTSVSFDKPLASSTTSPAVTSSRRSTNYANWIIYRLSEILLMKAEAEIQLGKSKVNDTVSVSVAMKPYYETAFQLASAVYNRANNLTELSVDTLKLSDYTGSVSLMENFIVAERQRELMFEGKRWFDLLRVARREGNNDKLVNHAIKKQTSNTAAIRIKLSSKDAIYYPYNENELKLNPYLTQNPAYETNKSTTISD
jgi:hypothetical protein